MIARPRLVVCDLDGTLVDQPGGCGPTIAAVKRLREAGIGIAVISARAWWELIARQAGVNQALRMHA